MPHSMPPEEAVERYLAERKPEVSSSTLRNHRYALKRFLEWTDEAGVEDISKLNGFHIHDFKMYRRETSDVNEVTLRNNLSVIRVFTRWLESMEAIEGDIADKIQIPNPDEDARDEKIERETAHNILEYLTKYEYASLRHVLFALLWDTGFRLGTVRALDLEDYHSEEQYVEVKHRPDEDTPLKNKGEAEREVNLHDWVCEAIDDYIEINRPDVEDDYGRKPLITTQHGRPAGTNLRQNINALTRPCHYTNECPHDREIDECEAAGGYNQAQRCPSSVPPHTIRRSAITAWLNDGFAKELLSGRMNVRPSTLDKHYDARTESEKRELRREAFDMNEE
ncbi:integrase [Halorubrum salipaludis]|uniref:Integrase n=1 Tax=Halorubrum salipaludis TaxID=2032630 RepID=A0A2A2F2C7_9EURY|nr:site-specific integrase [Halorubrum salipaludis]PAU78799.1 integrase [Halorubrum salipaludis]